MQGNFYETKMCNTLKLHSIDSNRKLDYINMLDSADLFGMSPMYHSVPSGHQVLVFDPETKQNFSASEIYRFTSH